MPSVVYSSFMLTSTVQARLTIFQSSVAEPEANLVGALLFFTYIIAALFLSTYILLSISRISTYIHAKHQIRHGRNLQQIPKFQEPNGNGLGLGVVSIFAVLALASFSVLSWNMLNFLKVSYSRWAIEHDIEPTFKIGDTELYWHHLNHIWHWSLDSNLFQTFAENLISRPTKWRLVRAALIYSYTWNAFMSTLGHKYSVPNLWTYFVLGQILPVSFTQHLFCIALTKVSPYHPPRARVEADVVTYTGLGFRILSLSCYCAALYWMPLTISTQQFFPTLFALRLLLLTPFVLDHLTFKPQPVSTSPSLLKISKFNNFLLVGSISLWMMTLPSRITANKAFIVNEDESYAAATLSNDMIMGAVGGVVFLLPSTTPGFPPLM